MIEDFFLKIILKICRLRNVDGTFAKDAFAMEFVWFLCAGARSSISVNGKYIGKSLKMSYDT